MRIFSQQSANACEHYPTINASGADYKHAGVTYVIFAAQSVKDIVTFDVRGCDRKL